MPFRRRVYSGVLFVVMMYGIAIPEIVDAAPNRSPLQRPIDSIKRDLAKVLKCTWEDSKYGSNCWTDKNPRQRASYSREDDGNVGIVFRPFLKDIGPVTSMRDGSVTESDPPDLQQSDVINAVATLFPSWKNSRAWLRQQIENSRALGFQTSLRVNETSIYVRWAQYPTGSFPEHTLIVLTTEKDLHRFKEHPCEDDEQGWAREGCTGDGDGYTMRNPRPPDNPILLLK
jgi:hypothetical protein